MRIAVSSRSFRRPLASRELTQLEWLERCASQLEVDGAIADVTDFPRTDGEYVAQLRKVAVDLGLVPFGIDAPGALDPDAGDEARERLVALASGFGASLVRTVAPPPGEVPPATFVRTVAAAKALSRAAKAANVTVVVVEAPGTIATDLDELKHVLKDTDSAWLRACPPALQLAAGVGPKDRYPACLATPADPADAVAAAARARWVILDVPDTTERPWDALATGVEALRAAEARLRLAGDEEARLPAG